MKRISLLLSLFLLCACSNGSGQSTSGSDESQVEEANLLRLKQVAILANHQVKMSQLLLLQLKMDQFYMLGIGQLKW